MIDAPVSSGTRGADYGTLTLMIGGADIDVERCLPVLEPMAGRIFRTGNVGSGHALKTLSNILSGLNTVYYCCCRGADDRHAVRARPGSHVLCNQ